MVQKTWMIELAGPLVAMDWDLQTSLVSQAATQATSVEGDWKLPRKNKTKTTKKSLKTFQLCNSDFID